MPSLRYNARLQRRVVVVPPVSNSAVIFYECRTHGRIHRVVTIAHHPCCSICRDTAIIRYKWTPRQSDRPGESDRRSGTDRPRVSRHPGEDVSRNVEIIRYL